MMKVILGMITAMLTTISTPLAACAVLLSPADQLTRGYEKDQIVAVALVTISKTNYTAPPISDSYTWQATATVSRLLRGFYFYETVKFYRGGVSGICDDGHPLPKIGEQWVVYFVHDRDGALAVWQSYPAITANNHDPKLKGRIL